MNNNSLSRATGLLVIEVRNSNPNGDPDQDSDPRNRSHDRRGVISGVSFKRKVRDLIEDKSGPVWNELARQLALSEGEWDRFGILESRGRNRGEITQLAKDGKVADRYWDARVFGATFLEEGTDFIRGGVAQFGLGVSVAPIEIERMTNTNKAGVQEGKDRGMAPLGYRVVQHGVYTMPFFLNASAALKTGCDAKDIELLLALIPYAYPHTASHSRPSVEVRHAHFATHKTALGSFSDFAFLDAMTPTRKGDAQQPSTRWEDYEVPTDPGSLRDRMAEYRDLCALG